MLYSRGTKPHGLAIASYPSESEMMGEVRDGIPIAVRPIRPEGEPLLQDIFAHMSNEDRRVRFFASMRKLSHLLAARLSQIDYDREMRSSPSERAYRLASRVTLRTRIGGVPNLPSPCEATGRGAVLAIFF